MNGDAATVSALDEPLVDDGDPAAAYRDLGGQRTGQRPAEEADRGELGRSRGRAQAGAESPAEAEQPEVAERTDAHPVEEVGPVEQRGQRIDAPIGLAVEVPPHVRPRVEQLVEPGDRLTSVDARGGDLTPRQLGDPPRPRARAGEVVVVERHRDPVGGDLNVRFEISEAELDGALEGGAGVLGRLTGPAPVGERDRPRPVEERVALGPSSA